VFGLDVGESHAFSAEAITDAKVLVVRRSALIGLAGRDGNVARQIISGSPSRRHRARSPRWRAAARSRCRPRAA
jgi:CRP/FNR family nitrogen fixation transcriptional regulator